MVHSSSLVAQLGSCGSFQEVPVWEQDVFGLFISSARGQKKRGPLKAFGGTLRIISVRALVVHRAPDRVLRSSFTSTFLLRGLWSLLDGVWGLLRGR